MFVLQTLSGGSGNPAVLERLGAIVPDLSLRGEWWRLVTATFLHIGIVHFILNTFALYQLGSLFETMFGSPRLLLVYSVSGVIASLASVLFSDTLSAGASGAIFGVLGALILSIRRSPHWRRETWTRGLNQQLIAWAVINMVIGASFPGIDNAAHIGGFLSGLLLGLLPHRLPPPPPHSLVIEVDPARE